MRCANCGSVGYWEFIDTDLSSVNGGVCEVCDSREFLTESDFLRKKEIHDKNLMSIDEIDDFDDGDDSELVF